MKIELYNLDYEKTLIASLFKNPFFFNKEIVENQFMAGFFFDERNRILYDAIKTLYETNITPNILTVTNFLKEQNKLLNVGVDYIASITDFENTPNFNFYLKNIKSFWQKRQLIDIIENTKKTLFNSSIQENQTIIEMLQDDVMQLQLIKDKNIYVSLEDTINQYKIECEKKRQNKDKYTGIQTLFKEYDDATSGLQDEELIIIGARPSLGKTAMAISMMNNIINQNIPCAFFSLEMSKIQILQRFLAIRNNINLYFLRSGLKDDIYFNKIFNSSKEFGKLPLYLVDETNINIKNLKAKARYLKTVYDIKVMFIDYIGLIESDIKNIPVYEQQSFISKELKKLTKELKIPIVALCQLNRNAENKEPTLADLRGSGSIEQDADQIIILHGDRLSSDPIQERDFILMKNRNGMTFKNKVKFIKGYAEYKDV